MSLIVVLLQVIADAVFLTAPEHRRTTWVLAIIVGLLLAFLIVTSALWLWQR